MAKISARREANIHSLEFRRDCQAHEKNAAFERKNQRGGRGDGSIAIFDALVLRVLAWTTKIDASRKPKRVRT